jgi:hypothetical protein
LHGRIFGQKAVWVIADWAGNFGGLLGDFNDGQLLQGN